MSRAFDEPPDDSCGICGRPIVDHVDAVYAIPDGNGRFRHWDCWEKTAPKRVTRKDLDDASRRFHDAMDRVRDKVKELRMRGKL